MFPFHTWLPAAHVQAPSAGSVILAAVLLKMGTYGFLRFSLPMTPSASEHFAPLMIAISIASILYGGFVALGQTDIKKLIAYSSVAHMGFVTLGIFLFSKEGVQGAIFQMLNHGIITGALFCMVGAVYERSHSRDIGKNLGLGKFLPFFMLFWGLFGFASFGFPGTNGFVGELLVLTAAFKFKTVIGILCIPGALLAAAYIFKVTLKLAWGEPTSVTGDKWYDLNKKEGIYLAGPAALVIYLGLAPTGLLNVITPAIDDNLASYHARKGLVSESASAGAAAAPSSAAPAPAGGPASAGPESGDPAAAPGDPGDGPGRDAAPAGLPGALDKAGLDQGFGAAGLSPSANPGAALSEPAGAGAGGLRLSLSAVKGVDYNG
jgi:NADH-quinone oxidoreductase subunit M